MDGMSLLLLVPFVLACAASSPSEIPLTAETAVNVALSRAPALKAARARAEAEKAMARVEGRPEEPRFTASHKAGSGDGRTEMALTFDLWSLIGAGGRRRAGAAQSRRADAVLAETALALAAETKSALYTVQAASAAYALRREAADALSGGKPSDLKLAASAQAELDADQALFHLEAARSRLAGLMRVPTNSGWWTTATLADPPQALPDAAALAALARERRPSLKAALEAAKAATERAGAWNSEAAGSFRLGMAAEKMPDGTRLAGPAMEMELPLFATMAPRFEATAERAVEADAQAEAAEAELTTQLEILRARLAAARRAAAKCREVLVPARARIAAASPTAENSAALLAARLKGLEAQLESWTTLAALEGAVGGSFEGGRQD
jgi:cobalt-zinc-cadmium efflux system outer membrane protein